MLSAADMPQILKRSHIVSGYRPLHQPRHYYIKSAFTFHNECLNIWTHFLPVICLFFYYILPEISSENPRFPVLVLQLGITTLLLGSSFAHMLHSRSPLDHIFWFLVDFSGIALFGVCIGLQRYSCEEEMHIVHRLSYLPLLLLVVLGLQFFSTCYLFVCKPQWPYRLEVRMLSCLLLAIWLYVPLAGRYTTETENDPSLKLHSRAFQWLLVSGIFMGAQVPERFAPGKFDIFGYGHQLFHLCINMVAWNLCDAADLDCSHRTAAWNTTVNVWVASSLAISASFIVFTVYKLMRKALGLKYE